MAISGTPWEHYQGISEHDSIKATRPGGGGGGVGDPCTGQKRGRDGGWGAVEELIGSELISQARAHIRTLWGKKE